ncbi:WD repeat-containing protein 18 isoform X1 [Drosophila guanche]|uniref:Blast:WD repeat-containing protein 18 n=2 Tax=Drosophila guanche TaxID=7266 RepID=A0A3B0KB76_DROGU|nr:WD repeat-containing protein 18 isoform X1 [Drosophila guanche]SPP89972.1 blast:WD repeat-containing protein 18 [Drosophila guanche]
MGDAVEVLFVSACSEENTTCSVQDLRTGTDLMKYKGGGNAQHHSLAMLGLNYVLAANTMKPLLHVWPINKQEQMLSLRFVLPGKANAMALTPDGAYLLVGIQESIYIWHMNTGRMLNTLSKHYQAITCLRFTDNGEHFISAGKDGAVLVWDLTFSIAPLDNGSQEGSEPLYSFNDHGLAVTDLHTGIGGIRSYLYTVSLDRCCKVYDLNGGIMLLSIVFPVALHSVVVNRMETSIYVGSAEGKAFVFHNWRAPRMKEYHLEEEKAQAFIGHTVGKPITSLALTMNAQQMVSAGDDKQVCVWDVVSRQLMKSISQNGVITNLRIRLLSPAVFQPQHKQPQLFADSLKRMISPPDPNDYIDLLITTEYPKGRGKPKRNFNKCNLDPENSRILQKIHHINLGEDDDAINFSEKTLESSEQSPKEEDVPSDVGDFDCDNIEEEDYGEADTNSPSVQKLIAENRRLKMENEKVAEIMSKYLANQSKNVKAPPERNRKKARKN